jgi:hypothetical protein
MAKQRKLKRVVVQLDAEGDRIYRELVVNEPIAANDKGRMRFLLEMYSKQKRKSDGKD